MVTVNRAGLQQMGELVVRVVRGEMTADQAAASSGIDTEIVQELSSNICLANRHGPQVKPL